MSGSQHLIQVPPTRTKHHNTLLTKTHRTQRPCKPLNSRLVIKAQLGVGPLHNPINHLDRIESLDLVIPRIHAPTSPCKNPIKNSTLSLFRPLKQNPTVKPFNNILKQSMRASCHHGGSATPRQGGGRRGNCMRKCRILWYL